MRKTLNDSKVSKRVSSDLLGLTFDRLMFLWFEEQDPLVEALKATTLPLPQMAKHVQGGRPLSEPMLTPHSPQTNNG